MAMKYDDEGVLLKEAALGNEEAFAKLYTKYNKRIEEFIRKYLRSNQLSEDICQNVFVAIWAQRAQLASVEVFSAFVFTIAKRHAFNFLKHASVEQNALGIIISAYKPENNVLEDNINDKEYVQFIRVELAKLPIQTQHVFELCRQQNKSYKEAAEILGISSNAVKKHMVRAMRKLGDAANSELGLPLSIVLIIISSK